VVAEERNKKNADSKRPKLRPLLRSMFGWCRRHFPSCILAFHDALLVRSKDSLQR
jgi:hypothetical protein